MSQIIEVEKIFTGKNAGSSNDDSMDIDDILADAEKLGLKTPKR